MFLPGDDTSPDVSAVLKTAALLSISEFRLFHVAYVRWYGRDADDDTIESFFVPYMFREEVPPWVRSFTRRALTRDRQGTLDPRRYGIVPEDELPRNVSRGGLYATGVAMFFALLVVLARGAAAALGLADCFFPPCF